ncbi:MAG TPA: hypothetical protein VK543_12855 [Puia sp.]|nr:hypothetical protein [Puia sp.]
MVKQLLFIASFVLVSACKSKKVSLAGNEPVDVHQFIEYFQPIKLPVQFSDTVLARKRSDSLEIAHTVFTQFVPDSVLVRSFGKSIKPKLFPVGKTGTKNEETYIFIKALSPGKKILYVLCFDNSEKFVVAKPLIVLDGESHITWLATMDSKYTLTILRQRKIEGQVFYKKEAYVFNSAGVFTLILTESNEPKSSALVYNPIDTLPRKHKFSGDYVQDKRNFVSVRDWKDGSRMQFFVHFEKDQGTCKGELKGEAKFVGTNLAHYKTSGDGCVMEFAFSASQVRIKELEGCGNHRDIKCFFEGSFEKRKEAKAKPGRKKK